MSKVAQRVDGQTKGTVTKDDRNFPLLARERHVSGRTQIRRMMRDDVVLWKIGVPDLNIGG